MWLALLGCYRGDVVIEGFLGRRGGRRVRLDVLLCPAVSGMSRHCDCLAGSVSWGIHVKSLSLSAVALGKPTGFSGEPIRAGSRKVIGVVEAVTSVVGYVVSEGRKPER